jgi:ATP-dependent Lhr-like helicase
MAFIGPAAEQHFGRRHFMELLSAFTAEPELEVLSGRTSIGSVAPLSVIGPLPAGQPRVLVLAGRTWLVTSIDFSRRRVQVVEHTGPARTRWTGGVADVSFELAQGIRHVLLGQDPPVELGKRALAALQRVRVERTDQVDVTGLVLRRTTTEQLWWTFGGTRANNSLAGVLQERGIEAVSNAECIRMPVTAVEVLRELVDVLTGGRPTAPVDQAAIDGLKFSAALPADLARATLQERRSDSTRAEILAGMPLVIQDSH